MESLSVGSVSGEERVMERLAASVGLFVSVWSCGWRFEVSQSVIKGELWHLVQ